MSMVLTILSVTAMQSASIASAPAMTAGGAQQRTEYTSSAADDNSKLLGLAQEWVDTWNQKNMDRMQQLHGDDLTYGIFGSFTDGREMLAEMRRENFWGLSWSLRMEEEKVRALDADTALVLFRLVGMTTSPKGSRPYRALFTLVFQKRAGEWKIVHVHDSEASETGS